MRDDFFQSKRRCFAGYPRLPHADRRSLMIEGGIRRCIDWPNYPHRGAPTIFMIAYDNLITTRRGICEFTLYNLLPIGSMYAIYSNIYHQYTPFMLAYIPYMDPMGYIYAIYTPFTWGWVQPSMMFDFKKSSRVGPGEKTISNGQLVVSENTIEMAITRSNDHSPVDFGAFPNMFQVFTSQNINKMGRN